MSQSVRSFVLSVAAVLVSHATLLAHPGHDHAADRPLAEQLAHPAFGWEVYILVGVAACALITWAAWRRGSKAQ